MLLVLLLLSCVPGLSLVSRISLSPSGPSVSRIMWGTLHLFDRTPAETLELLRVGLSVGITTIDTADVYGGWSFRNVGILGQALAMQPALRSSLEIIAKMNVKDGYDSSPEHLDEALTEYLKVLGTNYIDILLLHRQDYLLDVDQVASLFRRWRDEGKVRFFGTSNFSPDTFLNLNSRIPLVTNEVEASVWAPETIAPPGSGPISPNWYFTNNGLVDFHYRRNESVLAWGPLGGDPYARRNRLFVDQGARQTNVLNALRGVGAQIGEREDIVALAWLLRHPAKIIPIIGTMNATRLVLQSKAETAATKLTAKQWYDIAREVGVPLP